MSSFIDLMEYPNEQLRAGKEPFALDTETLGATRRTNIPIYFSAAARDFGAVAGPTTTVRGYTFLTELCESPRTKIFQNLKFDVWALEREGIEVRGPFEDTILMHCLLDEHHLGHHKLKVLSREILGRPRLDELELWKAQARCKLKLNTELPQKILHDYSLPDAQDTLDLYYVFKPLLEAQNLWKLYRQTVAAELVYLKMYRRGVALDEKNLTVALEQVQEALQGLSERIWTVFGEKFKISSAQQLGCVLKKKFNLVVKTNGGDWCTDKDALEPFRSDPKMQLILAWKYLDKARQYMQGYFKRVTSGRLHSEYRQTTTTGRTKSSNPNLENIPKQRGRLSEVEVGSAELAEICADAFRWVRAAIIPSPGWGLLTCDAKQIEYRCFAFYSGSKRLIGALERGEDFHSYVCKIVFGEETPQLRYITKIIDYGLIYGMGKDLLITRIRLYHTNPFDVLHQYEQLLPEMRETQKRLKKIAAQKGYLIDPFGRRYRFLPERPHAVVAWLCQGTAANFKKAAMVKTDEVLERNHCRGGQIIEIHDELVFEIPSDEAEIVQPLHAAMEDFDQLGSIPILYDCAVGPNLLDTTDVSVEDAIKYLKGAA